MLFFGRVESHTNVTSGDIGLLCHSGWFLVCHLAGYQLREDRVYFSILLLHVAAASVKVAADLYICGVTALAHRCGIELLRDFVGFSAAVCFCCCFRIVMY